MNMLAVLIGLFPVTCSIAQTSDIPADVGSLSGRWLGIACFCGYVTHNEFKIKEDDGKLTVHGYYAIAMSEKEIRGAVAKKLNNDDVQPFAMLVFQDYEVWKSGSSIMFKGGKGRVVFSGSEESGKWMPDTYEGRLVQPGMAVGVIKYLGVCSNTTRPKDGVFYFYREDMFAKPPALSLEKGKVHQLTCLDGTAYHYSCYVPEKYDPVLPAPVLINKDPSGNGKPLSLKMADELGWIMVGLTESRNDAVDSTENCVAVIFDLKRRFNIHPHRLYFSGLSGRARQSAWESIGFPDECAGVICIGAGFSQYGSGEKRGEYKFPPLNIPVFFLVGKTDMNHNEVVGYLAPAEKKRGRMINVQVHPGGHDWGRPEDHTLAIRWLDGLWKEH
ncbi:MAG: hypothetical protein A2283_00300 [Lentisphaerae bacterium RIFOXYA12_FULL_48_11]|nr:MAG: hypothetical protein A2283_00300 [Lentisphaerae bacterium RIFOXYA12_FULL_48_11]